MQTLFRDAIFPRPHSRNRYIDCYKNYFNNLYLEQREPLLLDPCFLPSVSESDFKISIGGAGVEIFIGGVFMGRFCSFLKYIVFMVKRNYFKQCL